MDVIRQLGIRGLNHLIHCESWAQERLVKHSGAQLLVDASLFRIRLGIDEQGLFRLSAGERVPDVTLTLPPDFAVRALFDRDKLFSAVKLDGSVDVAESLAFVFRNLRWDAEADLAGLIGDIPAYRLSRIGRSLALALQEGVRNTALNIQEFAVEEAGILLSPCDMAAFSGAVSHLRDDVALLEKRLAKL